MILSTCKFDLFWWFLLNLLMGSAHLPNWLGEGKPAMPSQAIPGHPRPPQVAICCHEFSRMSREAHPFPAQGTLLWCRGGREAPGPEPILTLRQAARGGREVETDGRCCEMTTWPWMKRRNLHEQRPWHFENMDGIPEFYIFTCQINLHADCFELALLRAVR